MVTTFGGIELDNDERSFLALGPDYAIFDDLVLDEIEKEMQITTTKISRQGWRKRKEKSHIRGTLRML